ncbi:MAG: T9SS type A sorting domain-containing protein, partial [Flavobacteriaceae bacterium]|nr:T9SS type A sorting domain-containing protein [Flavobacteriaceae bacterium]
VPGPIAAGATGSYSFTTTADLSANGSYTVCAKTVLVGDQNPSNDQFCKVVNNLSCIPMSTEPGAPPAGCNLDGIKRFVLGTIDIDDGGIGCNTEPASSPKGYANRTHLSTDLDRVSGLNTHVLQAMHMWDAAPANAEQISVWIDFNYNGTFEPSEQLLSGGTFPSHGTLHSFNITIPPTANLGSHILRARCIDTTSSPGDPNDPCANFRYGETHDYTVNIIDTLSTSDNELVNGDFEIFSLDGNNFDVELATTNPTGNLRLSVHNILGQLISSMPIGYENGKYQHRLDMSTQATGVYLVTLQNDTMKKTKKIIVK